MAATDELEGSRFSLGRNQDIILGACVMAILLVLIVPVPTGVLDVLLTANISLSVVVLLATIYLQRPVEFAVLPSLLLMLTLFRLSLNVATTRLILTDAHAGQVIDAFGVFVTAGSYVVGFVIFSILVIVQFVVITRGAGRISEVAARFTLDAMPGKQMGVDADLNAGLITEEEARTRRREIERESDFFGAMDGATKFVRGDAIAAIIIVLVNIIFGLVMGMVFQGMDILQALTTYTTLTVGDGLVSQIPALLISTAAGLVVTRSVSEENLGVDLGEQLTRYPRALAVGAVLLGLFGLVPGMPALPFLIVAAALGFLSYHAHHAALRKVATAKAQEVAEREAPPEEEPTRPEDLLLVDPIKVELGYALIPLADTRQGGDLLTRVQALRQQMASRMGFIVPVIRIVDNMRLRPNEYNVKLREAVVARYELLADHYLAMNPGLAEEEIEGIPTEEPAFGLHAIWVSQANRDRAERLGYTIVEPSAVLATHLTEIITNHAPELLTRQDVQNLIDNVKERSPKVVDELVPNILTLGEVQKVLQNLLRERVSIRNLEIILETLADFGTRTKDPELLTEYCRHALARQISADYADEENKLRVTTLSPELEQEVLEAVRSADSGEYIPLEPARADELARAAAEAVQPLVMAGYDPILLTSAQIRRYVKRIVERAVPRMAVLSYNEIDPAVHLESGGQVSV